MVVVIMAAVGKAIFLRFSLADLSGLDSSNKMDAEKFVVEQDISF